MSALGETNGDINLDGQLDAQDLALLRSLIESNPALISHLSPQEQALLDINQDGQINQADLMALCTRLLNANLDVADATSSKLEQLRRKVRHSG